MSKYTTQVRYICLSLAGYKDELQSPSIDIVLEKAHKKVFDFDYPIFDEKYRAILEKKILNHYYTREICAETVYLWKHFLQVKMIEDMPYFNDLYKTTILEFNPLYSFETWTESKNNQEQKSNNSSESENINKYSDTPQGGITNLKNDTYLTSAGIDANTSTSANTLKNTNDYLEHTYGTNTNYPDIIKKYRDNILNIDKMVIDNLSDLFFNLW